MPDRSATVFPDTVDQDGDRGHTSSVFSAVLAGLTILLVLGVLFGVGFALVRILSAPLGSPDPAAAAVTIAAGQPPAVAAQGGRIVDTDCVLFGPIEAVPDRSGAFRVTDGASEVACPNSEFRAGMTLRWPQDEPAQTVPAG